MDILRWCHDLLFVRISATVFSRRVIHPSVQLISSSLIVCFCVTSNLRMSKESLLSSCSVKNERIFGTCFDAFCMMLSTVCDDNRSTSYSTRLSTSWRTLVPLLLLICKLLSLLTNRRDLSSRLEYLLGFERHARESCSIYSRHCQRRCITWRASNRLTGNSCLLWYSSSAIVSSTLWNFVSWVAVSRSSTLPTWGRIVRTSRQGARTPNEYSIFLCLSSRQLSRCERDFLSAMTLSDLSSSLHPQYTRWRLEHDKYDCTRHHIEDRYDTCQLRWQLQKCQVVFIFLWMTVVLWIHFFMLSMI